MSPCGTFTLIGSADGNIDMYNLQSGIHRQRFPSRLSPAQARQLKEKDRDPVTLLALNEPARTFAPGEGKHIGRVTGIQVDNLNKAVVSCGEDGLIKFWSFEGQLSHEMDFSLTSAKGMRYHRPSDLIAVSCADGYVRVIDITTRKLVRELNANFGLSKGIGLMLDFCFSPDGRWVLASSEDRVLRIWDLSTGHLIEALRFQSAPRAIAFSPTGEFLATSHADSVGVTIWTNRTLFTHVSTRQIKPTDIIDVETPTASGEGGENALEAAFAEDATEADSDDITAPTIDQLSKDLLTLSLVPKPRWHTLLHLDLIRQRNKPLEPPQKPKAAPFFLPSLNSTTKSGIDLPSDPTTTASTLPASVDPASTTLSRITRIPNPATGHTTTFTTLLRSNSLTALLTHLCSLPPSSADLAIRTLDPAPPYAEPAAFITALTRRLRHRRDFELVQTWMAVFLRCHRGLVAESPEVREALEEWKVENGRVVGELGGRVGFCRGIGGWVGGVV